MALTFTFDKVTKTITVELPDTGVTVQQVVNAIREFEDDLVNMDVGQIMAGAGKDDLGGGVYTGITLKLVNDWRLMFADRAGPTYVRCKVSGGNLIATNSYGDDPIKQSAYTQVLIAQSTSAALIDNSTPADIADAVWDEPVSGHGSSGTFAEELFLTGDVVAELLDLGENKLVVNVAASELWLYDDAGTSIVKRWPLKNKSGGAIEVDNNAPTTREKRTL